MVDAIEAPAPSESGGGGAGRVFSRQVGPLPAWGWALVLGVAGAIVVVRRRKSASTPAATGTTTYAQQAQIPTIGNAAGAGGTPIVTGRPSPTTNDQWRSLAVTTLLAKGYSPLGVDTAMGKYLQGVSLDSTERALIDIALAEIGTPPNPPPPAQSAPTTTTPGLPAWITGSNLTRDPLGSVTALDQTYGGATPEGFVPGVTAAHFDVDPTTHAITGAWWMKNGVKTPLPDWAVQAYQAQGVDKLAGVSVAG